MRRLVARTREAARSASPALIVGPSGSGKRALAHALHAWGDRAQGPFVTLECDGFPPSLQAREVFGCTAGRFPLAPSAHLGALERAAGGTLVLAHVEHLRPDVKARIARALLEGSFVREGGAQPVPLRGRLVATSDGTADALATFGAVEPIELRIDALAQRREDVIPLAELFVARSAAAEARPSEITPEARSFLLAEEWPGNVRELQEQVVRAARIAGAGPLTPDALRLALDSEGVLSFKEAKRAFEAQYVATLLRRCGGNISRAARLAGKDRKDFYDVIRRTGIDPSQFRD